MYILYLWCKDTIHSIPVLEIAVGHWPFSDQFQHLADQNPFWLAKFPVHFQWEQQSVTYKYPVFKKMADQFLILISSTAILCMGLPISLPLLLANSRVIAPTLTSQAMAGLVFTSCANPSE